MNSMMKNWGKIEEACACDASNTEDNATTVMPPNTFHFRCAARNTADILADINYVAPFATLLW